MRYINERYFQCFLKERETAVISNRGHEENKNKKRLACIFPAYQSLNLGFVLSRSWGKMGCQLYTQIGRSTPRRGSNLAIRTQSGPLWQRSLLITTFLSCKAHSQASAGHVLRLTCPQFQRSPSSGCKVRQDMNTRCCYFLQSVFPISDVS